MRWPPWLMLMSALLWAGCEPGSRGGNNVWTSFGPEGEIVTTLAFDPSTPTTLYAGTAFSGVFKSTTGERSWSAVNAGLPKFGVTTLALDPSTPTTLYAGTGVSGVFKSTDGGRSWSAINTGLSNTDVRALALDPSTPTTLYAGTGGSGVFKSTDGGRNWSAVNTGLPDDVVVRALALNPSTPATLYAGTEGDGVYKSTDGGRSWFTVNTGLPNLNVRALALDPSTPTTLYAGTEGDGVFAITFGGLTLSLNQPTFQTGDQLSLTAQVIPGATPGHRRRLYCPAATPVVRLCWHLPPLLAGGPALYDNSPAHRAPLAHQRLQWTDLQLHLRRHGARGDVCLDGGLQGAWDRGPHWGGDASPVHVQPISRWGRRWRIPARRRAGGTGNGRWSGSPTPGGPLPMGVGWPTR